MTQEEKLLIIAQAKIYGKNIGDLIQISGVDHAEIIAAFADGLEQSYNFHASGSALCTTKTAS